jgi:hypothetical protein
MTHHPYTIHRLSTATKTNCAATTTAKTAMKILLLIGLAVFFCSEISQADERGSETIHSKVYGTWSPPPELFDFWKGMKDEWWVPGHPNVKMLNKYFEAYAETHDLKNILPDVFQDLKQNGDPDGLRIALYSALVRDWNRKQVKIILSHYEAFKEGTAEHSIAEYFIADIEEEEAHSKDKAQ